MEPCLLPCLPPQATVKGSQKFRDKVSCRLAFYLFPDVLKTAAGGICFQLFSWFTIVLWCARASYSRMQTECTFPSSLLTCSVFGMTPPGGGSSNETKHNIQQKDSGLHHAARESAASLTGITRESRVICNNTIAVGGFTSLASDIFNFFDSRCELQPSTYPAASLISLSSLVLSCYPSLKNNSSRLAPPRLLSACFWAAARMLCCY